VQQPTNPQKPVMEISHELREITELLVKHHGLHEGLFDLALEFQIAVGAVGPDPASIIPGAMFGVRRIGIMKTERAGISTVDAAQVNPSSPAKKVSEKKPTRK
jgi:hypothetical protein